MKKFSVIIFIILLAGCTSEIVDEKADRLSVVVSFYPLAEFAKAVGSEKISVAVLVPPGVEPHNWEPSPQDITRVVNADVFVYNGAGLEGWINNILKVVDKKKTVVVEASAGIDTVLKQESSGGLRDPHVWLDPLLAAKEVENILAGFEKADSSGAEFYRFNSGLYISRLGELDNKFKLGFNNCEKKEFISSHEAFGYLARRYNIEQLSVAGISPDIEPAPRHVAELVDFIKQKNIKTIFVETMINPKVSEALARDAGASVDVLNPFEGLSENEILAGVDYFVVMEQNLNKLKNAMGCDR